MPHDRELMALTGVRATQTVCTLVERFIEHVLLAQEATSRLLPGSLVTGLPVLGSVAAGFPSPADEELTDTMSLEEYLIRNRDATYVLKVHGTSMRDAGILPGDLLLVERGVQPRDGDIVIAQVDRAWTMKFFRRRGALSFSKPRIQTISPSIPRRS